MIAWYSATILAEREKAGPDQDLIGRLLVEQYEYVLDQQRLGADDAEQITDRTEHYAALLEWLQAERARS